MDSKPLGFIPQTQFIRFPILLSIAQSERTYGPKQCEHWGGHIWTGLVLITIDYFDLIYKCIVFFLKLTLFLCIREWHRCLTVCAHRYLLRAALFGARDGLPERFGGLERTIAYSLALGGDTDTIACMAGAIAGAHYGIDSIPQSWQESCEGVEEADDLARRLYDLYCLPQFEEDRGTSSCENNQPRTHANDQHTAKTDWPTTWPYATCSHNKWNFTWHTVSNALANIPSSMFIKCETSCAKCFNKKNKM